jgi:hypothetical protein
MRTLIFACVSVLAFGTAGSQLSDAADMSNGNTPGTSYVSERQVEPIGQQPKTADIHRSAIGGSMEQRTMHEARSRKFHQQRGLGPKGVRYDFNLGRR